MRKDTLALLERVAVQLILMQNLDLQHLSSGTIVIVAPHMDDEALACGGLIAQLPNKDRIHHHLCHGRNEIPAPIIAGTRQDITRPWKDPYAGIQGCNESIGSARTAISTSCVCPKQSYKRILRHYEFWSGKR